MSLDNYIQELENEYKFLESHVAVTAENWRDFVKEKFFNEHLNSMPNEYSDFNSELQRISQSLDSAENIINSLK
jgi:archaellum component FlaC